MNEILFAVVLALLISAWLADHLDLARSTRGALHSARERGEMDDEEYARGLRALEEPV